MNKSLKIILSICLIALGLFLDAFGFTTSLGHPLNTICLISGIIIMIVGVAFLARH